MRHTAAVKILFFIKDVLKNLFIDKKKQTKKQQSANKKSIVHNAT